MTNKIIDVETNRTSSTRARMNRDINEVTCSQSKRNGYVMIPNIARVFTRFTGVSHVITCQSRGLGRIETSCRCLRDSDTSANPVDNVSRFLFYT